MAFRERRDNARTSLEPPRGLFLGRPGETLVNRVARPPHDPPMNLLLLALTLPVYLWAGAPFLQGAIRTLSHRTANMDTLVGIGTTAALFAAAAII